MMIPYKVFDVLIENPWGQPLQNKEKMFLKYSSLKSMFLCQSDIYPLGKEKLTQYQVSWGI